MAATQPCPGALSQEWEEAGHEAEKAEFFIYVCSMSCHQISRGEPGSAVCCSGSEMWAPA